MWAIYPPARTHAQLEEWPCSCTSTPTACVTNQHHSSSSKRRGQHKPAARHNNTMPRSPCHDFTNRGQDPRPDDPQAVGAAARIAADARVGAQSRTGSAAGSGAGPQQHSHTQNSSIASQAPSRPPKQGDDAQQLPGWVNITIRH